MTPTVPVARGCPRCGGWFTRRVLEPVETATTLYTCIYCGEDIRIDNGMPVSVTYRPDAPTLRRLVRHEHAARVLDGQVRRKAVEA